MWVDRAFSVAGAGTVVTGTLVDGAVAVDDELTLYPGAATGRIRSLQSHERSLADVGPGSRTALNLVGIERTTVARGAMLGRSGEWKLSTRFVADLATVRGLEEPLRERGSYHLHLGSGAWPVRLRLLEATAIEQSGAALLDTGTALPLKVGDRFILREVGRRAVVAGGRILDPAPPRRTRRITPWLEPLRAASNPDEAATALLESRGTASRHDLKAHTGGGDPSAPLLVEDRAFSAALIDELHTRGRSTVLEYHDANPLRPGIPKASLAERLGVTVADLEALVDSTDGLELAGAAVRIAGFGVDLDDASRSAWEAAQTALEEAGASPPRRKDLGLDDELIHALVRRGDLVEVSADLLYLPESIANIEARAASLADGFTVADFRDALQITRKHAVPLLEWLDSEGVTVRTGDVRTVRRRQPPGEPGPGGAQSR